MLRDAIGLGLFYVVLKEDLIEWPFALSRVERATAKSVHVSIALNTNRLFQTPSGLSFLCRFGGAALPARGELTFEVLPATRARPALATELAREGALEEGDQQFVGALELRIIGDPHRAQVHGQLAPAAREILAADDGVDSLGFEKPLHEMRFSGVLRSVDLSHARPSHPARKLGFDPVGDAFDDLILDTGSSHGSSLSERGIAVAS